MMKVWFRKVLSSVFPVLLVGAGAFVIAYGWGAYHFSKRPPHIFALKCLALWFAAFGLFYLVKLIYQKVAERLRVGRFWGEVVLCRSEQLFFAGSLIFGLFFFREELHSLLYVFGISWILFWISSKLIAEHESAREWLTVHKTWFAFGLGILVLEMAVQYAAYRWYILDTNIRFFNIVLFRAVAMTFFWLFWFAIAVRVGLGAGALWRRAGLAVWSLLFSAYVVFWAVNTGILYYSGLYLSPIAIEHSAGASGVIVNWFSFGLAGAAVIVLVAFFALLRVLVRQKNTAIIALHYRYAWISMATALFVILNLTSFGNTPERAVARSFYDRYLAHKPEVTLDPMVQKKLEKFGLFYDTDQFYVHERPTTFSASNEQYLPKDLRESTPNVLIVFLESFSARLTGVYNPEMQDVTPHFNDFAAHPNTTVFKKYYNASTPTITGTLAQLCSFLPPTGHNEIQNERKMQRHQLLCLPEILKKHAGFEYAAYVTAVDKSFSHKDGIFGSMGVDDVLGTKELAKVITGEPLSWGYSDHQLFPATEKLMKQAPEPFLMMLATVDTHPPFDLPKDAVQYKDGSQPVLNMVHTTDHAFGEFWSSFKSSDFADNTIVIAVADHAIFPAALTQDVFPNEAGKLTYYDENFFAMYIPDTVLPKTIEQYSSGVDFLPTVMQLFDINVQNSFEGYSIFDDREDYPNVLGMHELGLYSNQIDSVGKRVEDYQLPTEIRCSSSYISSSTPDFTLCDYLNFYTWKRQMFEQGRFWKKH